MWYSLSWLTPMSGAASRLGHVTSALQGGSGWREPEPTAAGVGAAGGGGVAPPLGADARPLTDAQLREFIAQGVLQLPTPELAPELHRHIYDTCRGRWMESEPAGRERLTRDMFVEIPELAEVIGSPTLRGALTDLLGPGYVQHPHRTMHVRLASTDPDGSLVGSDQDFHTVRP